MLTAEEDVEITSLKKRGWTISAIARHVGHDRKTVRGYLSGEGEPGVRAKHETDPFDRFEPYVRQRLVDDQHVWATTLYDELVALGYRRSYQTFTRQLRDRQLRPHCEPCSASNGGAHVDIEHPPGEESSCPACWASDSTTGGPSSAARVRLPRQREDGKQHDVVHLRGCNGTRYRPNFAVRARHAVGHHSSETPPHRPTSLLLCSSPPPMTAR